MQAKQIFSAEQSSKVPECTMTLTPNCHPWYPVSLPLSNSTNAGALWFLHANFHELAWNANWRKLLHTTKPYIINKLKTRFVQTGRDKVFKPALISSKPELAFWNVCMIFGSGNNLLQTQTDCWLNKPNEVRTYHQIGGGQWMCEIAKLIRSRAPDLSPLSPTTKKFIL